MEEIVKELKLPKKVADEVDQELEGWTYINEKGQEVLDDRPLTIPIGMKRPESLQETIRRLVRNQISQAAQDQGFESFEDANDFDCPDDFIEGLDDSEYTLMEEEVIDHDARPGGTAVGFEEEDGDRGTDVGSDQALWEKRGGASDDDVRTQDDAASKVQGPGAAPGGPGGDQ